jgi:hypothetical protein
MPSLQLQKTAVPQSFLPLRCFPLLQVPAPGAALITPTPTPHTPLRISGPLCEPQKVLGAVSMCTQVHPRLPTSVLRPGLATMPPHHFPRLPTLLRPAMNVIFYLHRVSRKLLPSTLVLRLTFPSLTSLPLSINRESRPTSGHPLLRKTSWSTWMPKRSLSPVDQLPRIRPCNVGAHMQ